MYVYQGHGVCTKEERTVSPIIIRCTAMVVDKMKMTGELLTSFMNTQASLYFFILQL